MNCARLTSPPGLKPKTKGLLQELTRTILPRGANSAPAARPALLIHVGSCCREQEKQEKINSCLKKIKEKRKKSSRESLRWVLFLAFNAGQVQVVAAEFQAGADGQQRFVRRSQERCHSPNISLSLSFGQRTSSKNPKLFPLSPVSVYFLVEN